MTYQYRSSKNQGDMQTYSLYGKAIKGNFDLQSGNVSVWGGEGQGL